MNGKQVTNEAIFNTEEVLHVSREMLDELTRRARQAPRGRFRLCLHRSTNEEIQEMLIACVKGTYFRPHRNRMTNAKSYHVVLGELAVVLFDEEGQVMHRVRLGPTESGHPFLIRLADPNWHTPIPLSDVVVYHEVCTGPFLANQDQEYSSWSPPEGDPAVGDYLNALIEGSVNEK